MPPHSLMYSLRSRNATVQTFFICSRPDIYKCTCFTYKYYIIYVTANENIRKIENDKRKCTTTHKNKIKKKLIAQTQTVKLL